MKKVFSIIGVIAVIVVIIAAIVASMNAKPSNSDKVWDTEMSIGNPEAKNYFIIYSDLVCPYCVAFENAIVEHEEEFQEYIKSNDILVEIRLSDFLYEYGETHPEHSRYSALATYCAKNEGKFWDYYNLAITKVWNDFFKSSGKTGFSKLNDYGQEYWTSIGKKIGLGEEFESCIKEQKPLEEIKQNAAKSAKLASGMPYFKFNKFTSSGFDLAGDWQDVLMFFQAGLES
ncbi:thioredoxin domain-containing protein [Candidatus Saccharibacteria bacterium]|nr:thioredoxin domain-containing protein [Candidatus Saccharibacteria bacterium]